MKLWSHFLCLIAVTNMIFSPLVQAQNQSPASSSETSPETPDPQYQLTVDQNKKVVTAYSSDAEVQKVEFEMASVEKLRTYKPSALSEKLKNELSRINTANKAAFSHSLKALPTESFVFFMAMGAVVAGQLILDYSQNPTAMEDHIHHSLSPMGVIGFYTFMYSQGVTSNVLAMYMRNPKFAHIIPYLGMTVGVFMQSYLSQILMDPNVKACAKTWVGGKITDKDRQLGVSEDPCDQAYEYLVIQNKIWEFAPGIISMLISSGMAAGLQALVTKGVLRFTGVDLAVYLIPGKMQLTGFRLLVVKGLQIGVFAGLDLWINRKVTYIWKNLVDGKEFYDIQDRLNSTYETAQRGPDPEKTFEKELKNFRKKMSNWRMTNLAEVYESHQYWSENIRKVTGLYNASYNFYTAFINQIRNSKFQESNYRPLEYSSPLNGVIATGLKEGNEELYFSNPQFVSSMQLDTVKKTAAEIINTVNTNKFLLPPEKKALSEIAEDLNSDQQIRIGQGIQKLQEGLEISSQNLARTPSYLSLLNGFMKSLGKPRPAWGAGEGWVRSYEAAPSNAQYHHDLNYRDRIGHIITPLIGDHFVMQMLCGDPVTSDKIIDRPLSGFADRFNAPRIIPENQKLQLCDTFASLLGKPAYSIYRDKFTVNGKNYGGVIPYLIDQSIADVVGSKDNTTFEKWWQKNTESKIKNRFKTYARDYEDIVVKMVKSINATERSSFNGRAPLFKFNWKNLLLSQKERSQIRMKNVERLRAGGPIYNGALYSANQEANFYIQVLENILNRQPSLNSDLKSLLSYVPSNGVLKTLDTEFKKLLGLIRTIEIVKGEDDIENVKSDLENVKFEEQVQAVQTALQNLNIEFGFSENPDEEKGQWSESQKEIVILILQQFEGLASEVMMFGVMANAASWDKTMNSNSTQQEIKKAQSEAKSRVEKAQGMRMGGG